MSVQEICRVAENTQLGDGLFLMVLHAPKITELAQCGQFVHIACGARAAAELPRADPSVLPRGLLDRRDRVHFADAPIDHPFPSDTRPRNAARQAEGGVLFR